TPSQTLTYPGGQPLCGRAREEAAVVCGFIRGEVAASSLLERFRVAVSPGFDPERDLLRIGLANQTTMLMSESLEIQEMVRSAMPERYGEEAVCERLRG